MGPSHRRHGQPAGTPKTPFCILHSPFCISPRARWLPATIAALLVGPALAGWTATNDLLSSWLSARTNVQAWSASVLQTRNLKTLTQPVTTTGRVWFQVPNRFRWELGESPRTIAVRQQNRLVLLYPRLRRAELYPLSGENTGTWQDSLALIEAGFPRDASELEQRFELLSATILGSQLRISLRPRSPSARRWMLQIDLAVATNDFTLASSELLFADGSRLRNDFTNAIANPSIDAALFDPVIPPGYTVVQPPPNSQR